MNSKFLKKVALSCLVLGAVNYGNIGNTMENKKQVDVAEQNEQNYIKVLDAEEINEQTYNYYEGRIDGKSFKINAINPITLKTVKDKLTLFNKTYDDKRLIKAVNSKIEVLQDSLNRAIQNKLSNILDAYSLFLEYYNEKTGKVYSFQDIVNDTVAECMVDKKCKLDNKQLQAMVEYYTNSLQKNKVLAKSLDFSQMQAALDFPQRKQNEPKKVISIDDFYGLFSSLIGQIVSDLNVISQYVKKKDNDIMPPEFYTPTKKIAEQDMFGCFRKDVLGNTKRNEKINYDDCSKLVQYIIKYLPDDKFLANYGDYYTVSVKDDIKTFRYTFEALKQFAALFKQTKTRGFISTLKKSIAAKVNNSIKSYTNKTAALAEIETDNIAYEKNKKSYAMASEESAYISNLKNYNIKNLDLKNINDFEFEDIDERNPIIIEKIGDEDEKVEEKEEEKGEEKVEENFDPLNDLEGDVIFKENEVKDDKKENEVNDEKKEENEANNGAAQEEDFMDLIDRTYTLINNNDK